MLVCHYYTGILLSGRREKDTETGFEIGRLASVVGQTEINAVCEHEGAGPAVQDVLGGREHLPRHQLHVDIIGGRGAVGGGGA